ncbi:hypothetical protein [Paenibacillus sp. Z6-24]
MNTMNITVNKWIGSLLILAALAVYIIFQTRMAVMAGIVLLAAGIVISLLTIPAGDFLCSGDPGVLFYSCFYVVTKRDGYRHASFLVQAESLTGTTSRSGFFCISTLYV